VYVTEVPQDLINKCAAIDYQTAENRGYFKLDFLNMSVYQLVRDPAHYETLLTTSPPWQRLWEDPAWSSQLVHVGKYTDLLRSMRPDSVPRMAAFISIIRPGKAHLQNRAWSEVFDEVWNGDDSLSYAMLVVLHMNLLDEINPAS
jgi:hypothetical protein